MTRNKIIISASPVRSGYTLVEILVVVAIMGILLFIGMPAFEKLAKGSGVEFASRNLTGKLGLARSYAISNREYVALLMPTEKALGIGTNKLPADYIYKGYKLCIVTPTGTANVFNFKRWLPSEKWEFMPTGVSIVEVESAPGSTDLTASPSLDTDYPDKVENVDLYEIDKTKYSDEAVTHSHGAHAPVASGKCVTDVRAVVFKSTGKLAVTGVRYLTVGESTYNGTTLVHTGNVNRIDISIDQFTGKTNLETQ